MKTSTSDRVRKENKRLPASAASETRSSEAFTTIVDNRSLSPGQETMLSAAKNNPAANRMQILQAMADSRTENMPTQRAENKTGLPDNLKKGMERLSGYSLDHVRVHYNSAKPAAVQAHAFATGSEIHLAPGQEQHLSHELGHVVQQAQGRVKPTTAVYGIPVNNDNTLENEATSMGNRALQMFSEPGIETFQLRAVKAASSFISENQQADSSAFIPMSGAFAGITYQRMSAENYADWKNTVQAKTMHGTATHDGVVVVTRYSQDSDVMQHAGFLENGKGYLVAAEGLLAIAAGIALCAATGGAGVVPGVAAIATGVIKVARGYFMVKWGADATGEQKKRLDALRGLEVVAAGVGAYSTANIGLWIFAVAKAIRSLITAYTDQAGDDDSTKILWLKRISAACHFIESIALAGVGAGSIDAGKTVAGVAGVGIGMSKMVRSGDQAIDVAPSARTGWK